MLTEAEIRERARFCYCVFRQMNWLYGNSSIMPSDYIKYLQKSSLELAGDEFIILTLEEAAIQENVEYGLHSLINFYEGLTHALCEVLETDMETIKQEISPELMDRLASEVGVSVR